MPAPIKSKSIRISVQLLLNSLNSILESFWISSSPEHMRQNYMRNKVRRRVRMKFNATWAAVTFKWSGENNMIKLSFLTKKKQIRKENRWYHADLQPICHILMFQKSKQGPKQCVMTEKENNSIMCTTWHITLQDKLHFIFIHIMPLEAPEWIGFPRPPTALCPLYPSCKSWSHSSIIANQQNYETVQ